MLMWVYVHCVSPGATEGQVTSDLPEPGLQAIVSHLMWLQELSLAPLEQQVLRTTEPSPQPW